MSGHRFVWGKRTVEGRASPREASMHTISAPNIADVYDGYVRQLRPGTPWKLLGPDGSTMKEGTA
jgi:hypothetical protein